MYRSVRCGSVYAVVFLPASLPMFCEFDDSCPFLRYGELIEEGVNYGPWDRKVASWTPDRVKPSVDNTYHSRTLTFY